MSRTFLAKTFLYDGDMSDWLNNLERRFCSLTIHHVAAVVGVDGHTCITAIVSYVDEARL